MDNLNGILARIDEVEGVAITSHAGYESLYNDLLSKLFIDISIKYRYNLTLNKEFYNGFSI